MRFHAFLASWETGVSRSRRPKPNQAQGGAQGQGGADGQGVGGGVYNLGSFTEVFTVIKGKASTSDDNVFG
jgi:hypothetical protein